jgi:hypothetical protein
MARWLGLDSVGGVPRNDLRDRSIAHLGFVNCGSPGALNIGAEKLCSPEKPKGASAPGVHFGLCVVRTSILHKSSEGCDVSLEFPNGNGRGFQFHP